LSPWLIALCATLGSAVVTVIGWAGRAIMLRMRIKELPTAIDGTASADRAEIIRALLGDQPSADDRLPPRSLDAPSDSRP
jgi:hypothetical protein